jgi:glutamine amidotransferase
MRTGRVAVIDYGMGNVRSVVNAVEYCGHNAVLTADPLEIEAAERIILPGDGAFGDAMAQLESTDLVGILQREVLERAKPFLGICVGMQILATSSGEHMLSGTPHPGRGWFAADIVQISPDDRALKVPHMGWNEVHAVSPHPVLAGMESFDPSFYFVHSYWMKLHRAGDLVALTDYGAPLTAIVARDNIVATQFHPEKSQDNGIQLIANFLDWKA